jgi:hypothetical protein
MYLFIYLFTYLFYREKKANIYYQESIGRNRVWADGTSLRITVQEGKDGLRLLGLCW